MGHRELTEKDLNVDEKKVFGKIIDMWAAGDPKDPFARSTEARLIKYASEVGMVQDKVLRILKDLETRGLIHRVEEKGETLIKYRVESEHIVKELQKTSYVFETRDFKPPHH